MANMHYCISHPDFCHFSFISSLRFDGSSIISRKSGGKDQTQYLVDRNLKDEGKETFLPEQRGRGH